jgi:hypothetical protein
LDDRQFEDFTAHPDLARSRRGARGIRSIEYIASRHAFLVLASRTLTAHPRVMLSIIFRKGNGEALNRLPEVLAGLHYVAFVILMLKNVAEVLA